MKKRNTIYHIVASQELKNQIMGNYYTPVFFESDGFIHCTGEKETSLMVLEDYFTEAAKINEILILSIAVEKLEAEVKFEAPSPVPGGGTTHIKNDLLFPHIYGSLNLDAIINIGKTEMIEGKFVWPVKFHEAKDYI